jgi:hypothetical protein
MRKHGFWGFINMCHCELFSEAICLIDANELYKYQQIALLKNTQWHSGVFAKMELLKYEKESRKP